MMRRDCCVLLTVLVVVLTVAYAEDTTTSATAGSSSTTTTTASSESTTTTTAAAGDSPATTMAPHEMPISAPDIYPDSGDYVGQVQVQLLAQAQDADVFYTIDGSDPTSNSSRYFSGFPILKVGHTIVKAIAIPRPSAWVRDNRVASEIRNQTYHIAAELMPHPEANPSSGHFRGSLDVKLAYGAPLSVEEHEVVELQYVQKDATNPHNAFATDKDSWTKYNTKGIRIETVGLHYLFIRSFCKTNGSSSTTPRKLYFIDSPMVYDVSTECASTSCTDHTQPVSREWFTVTVQNAEYGSRMFLSYIVNCDVAKTMVDQTHAVGIDRHLTSHHFRTALALKEVYVCVRIGKDGPFQPIPRRGKAPVAAGDLAFTVITNDAGGAWAPLPPSPPQERGLGEEPEEFGEKGNREGGSGLLALIGLWVVALAVIVVIVRVARAPAPGSPGSSPSTTIRREVKDETELRVSRSRAEDAA